MYITICYIISRNFRIVKARTSVLGALLARKAHLQPAARSLRRLQPAVGRRLVRLTDSVTKFSQIQTELQGLKGHRP